MSIDPSTGLFQRETPPPDCEFTAPGSETEAVDCWEIATLRHVRDGVTVGVFCAAHGETADGVTVEDLRT